MSDWSSNEDGNTPLHQYEGSLRDWSPFRQLSVSPQRKNPYTIDGSSKGGFIVGYQIKHQRTQRTRGGDRTKESTWVNETVSVRKKRGDRKSNLHFALSPPCTWMVMNWLRWNEETLQRTCQQPVHVSSINGTITVPHIPLHKEATQVHAHQVILWKMSTTKTTGGQGC